jgi:hypothetical protein
MAKTKTIPIFPLDLVLFPNQELPLKIFEPRYKQMIDDCILSEKEFGVCLSNSQMTVSNWEAPYSIGTIAKIIDCKDVDATSGHLHINTKGHNRFRIIQIIPPCIEQPNDYDPFSIEGIEKIGNLHEDMGINRKMYIQAVVELINDIDESILLQEWNYLIELWKKKISLHVKPQNISSYELDNLLERYYLNTEIPTLDYVYSLCALGASSPQDLQTILESSTKEKLLEECEKMLRI